MVLVDYPGFNWWIARRAKAHGIPVFYYVPPQIWAWASWRVKKMRRFVDHVLCSLPFEVDWYAERGCQATFVGHPYFDEVRARTGWTRRLSRRQQDPERPLVTILPGSRTQEVTLNLKYFLEAAALVHARLPQVRFAIASFKPTAGADSPARLAAGQRLADRGPSAADARADPGRRLLPGRVGLGLAGTAVPYAADGDPVLDQPDGLLGAEALFRNTRYITLVNLLTAKKVFAPRPEPLRSRRRRPTPRFCFPNI